MLGLRDSRRISFTLGAALCCACPPATGTTDDADSGTGAPTTGDTSTTGEPTTGEPASGDGSSTSLPQTTGEGSTGELPGVMCELGACSVSCTEMVPLRNDNGQECFCEESLAPPEGWQTCVLQKVCGSPSDYVCMVQALRWGVVGQVWWHGFQMDDGGRSSFLDILGGGAARGSVSSEREQACCDGSSQDREVWYGPFTVPPPDAPFWQKCFTAQAIQEGNGDGGYSYPLPHCVDPETFVRACTGAALDVCPTPPPPPGPDATCAETCPMAGDGVCDEFTGTGLCPQGCDPLDCTCEADVPDQCDEVPAGGSCPIGSDPTDCTCGSDTPGVCDEIDAGGSCPLGSDPDCR